MIVSFPYVHFEGKKHPLLSKLMIRTLIAACESQRRATHFDPNDMNRAFACLIQQGFIISKEATINNTTESIWEITLKAIAILKNMGIEIPG